MQNKGRSAQTDSFDIVLIGTGVAPLVAANQCRLAGKRVLLLNPDGDFFFEDSELPLDPLGYLDSHKLKINRLKASTSQSALDVLRPDFPGAVEHIKMQGKAPGVLDPTTPAVRSRSRLWIKPIRAPEDERLVRYWEDLEEVFVHASDEGLNPSLLDGLAALKRFPGFGESQVEDVVDDVQGLLLPDLADVEVRPYRNDLLEYVRESLEGRGHGRIVCDATQIELKPREIWFYREGQLEKIEVREALMVFWTPKMTTWLSLRSGRRLEAQVRIWEEWNLISRDPLDSSSVGVFENLVVWAKSENVLSVLRAGPHISYDPTIISESADTWASQESFESLSHLCQEFMGWKSFSVISMGPRAVFDFKKEPEIHLGPTQYRARVVTGCDGPLFTVVAKARQEVRKLM